jgi:hypothetical protein
MGEEDRDRFPDRLTKRKHLNTYQEEDVLKTFQQGR